MFSKFRKKKDKKDKNDKSNAENTSQKQSNGKTSDKPQINASNSSNSYYYKNANKQQPPSEKNQSQHNNHNSSKDDLSAAEIARSQKRFAQKGIKKRHSHIGAMRHHQSRGTLNQKKSLNVPGGGSTIQESNEEDDDDDEDDKKRSNYNNSKKSQSKNNKKTVHNTMGKSAAMNSRLEQLMKMRAGKDAKGNRSRSVNVSKQKEKEQKYPKKRRSEVHKEPRRHSMIPDKEKTSETHEKHLKDRRKTIDKRRNTRNEYKKIQYRVKNELFVLYDYYQPVRIIGSGAYAVVCEAINTVTGKKVAVKKNKGVFDHITDARRILREIKLLIHFDHQDIISLLDVIPCDSTEIDNFVDVYLIMPKMETTLAKVIRSRQKLTDRHYQFFMYQMLRGLNYMHSANVIHRDLKPENILINGADCNVKITDFGLARGVCKDENIEKPTEYVVTRWYRSPEVMCSAGFYDEKVDIWSLGCIFAELILRRPLFPGQNYLDQLKIIFEVMGTPKDLKWIKTPEAKKWVQKLKPHNGKPLKQVFEKASKESLVLLSKMLKMDPDQRLSSMECLRHPYLKELHRKEDEEVCPPFDLSFEFEKAIKTKFGVRHMMYDALTKFQRENPSPTPQNHSTKK